MSKVAAELQLLDWKRRVSELYAEVRRDADPESGWRRWVDVRAELFRSHTQSPVAVEHRPTFDGPAYFDYDPRWRVCARLEPVEPQRIEVPSSGVDAFVLRRIATAHFTASGSDHSLDVFWIEGYGGGLFVSFRDATSGNETYGAGRYLYDTIKGADLGGDQDELVFDFNFAYNPSCSYDPKWVCPLAPPRNRLEVEVRAGERLP